MEEGWTAAEAPLIAHVGNLVTLSDLEVAGKELQPGFHMFIFGVDLRVGDDLTDSKNWRVDFETLDVATRDAGMVGENALDQEILAKEASRFDRISSEPKSVTAQVDSTASIMTDSLSGGTAFQAAQQALFRFRKAAARKIRLLNSISSDIQNTGKQNTFRDDELADQLALRAWNFRAEYPSSKGPYRGLRDC